VDAKLPKKLDKGLIAFLEKLKGAFAWSLKGTLKEYKREYHPSLQHTRLTWANHTGSPNQV
jgi:hypothetical protein